jgi:hypothetical protein
MTHQLDTAKVKLVTIIAPFELSERIAKDVRELGASGYTIARVNGWGKAGPRRYGIVDGANVCFEVIANAELAHKVLEYVIAKLSDDAVVAFVRDVEAVPSKHFLGA